jgi:hypothetical protein
VSRFRLRFLLQEFDLPIGEVVVGRSPDCHITIEDPLISRQHAKIVVTPTSATFVDLGSRNGSRINGRQVSGSTPLADADRIRLGAQELVFFEVGPERRAPRQTGAMLFCNKCATPFPEGARVCPHCGAPPSAFTREDETMSGVFLEPRRTWMLQLMGEVLERALSTQKLEEAERILQRAVDEFANRLAAADPVDDRQLTQIADYALRLARLQNDPGWVRWVTAMFGRIERVPAAPVLERLADAWEVPQVPALLADAVARWRTQADSLGSEERAALSRLHTLLQSRST